MRCKSLRGSESEQSRRNRTARLVALVLTAGAVIAVMALLSVGQQNPTPTPNPTRPILRPEANRPPDANDQMAMREHQQQQQNFDAINAKRLRDMTEASHMLETMAIALKAELDKTGSAPLSEEEIRKAETIEKLARLVKEEMQLTVAPN